MGLLAILHISLLENEEYNQKTFCGFSKTPKEEKCFEFPMVGFLFAHAQMVLYRIFKQVCEISWCAEEFQSNLSIN